MDSKTLHKQMILCILGISTVGIPLGLLGPVTVILLEKNHMPTWINGLFVTMSYLTIFIFSFITGKLINHYGIKKIFITGMVLMLIGSIGLPMIFNIPILFISRAIMGIGITFGFVSTEVLINVLSTEEKRNKNITLYIMIFSLGIAIGSALIWTVNVNMILPYAIATVIILVVLIISYLKLLDCKLPKGGEEEHKNLNIKNLPLIGIISAILYGFFESSITVVLPIYGLRTGFNQNETSVLITAFVLGGIVVYYYLSKVFDETNYLKYIKLTLLLLVIFLSFPIYIDSLIVQSIIFFLLGGLVPELYSLGLSYTMAKIEKQHTAEANGYYSSSYGFGTLVGPLVSSELLDIDAKVAYWITATILTIIVLSITLGVKNGTNKN